MFEFSQEIDVWNNRPLPVRAQRQVINSVLIPKIVPRLECIPIVCDLLLKIQRWLKDFLLAIVCLPTFFCNRTFYSSHKFGIGMLHIPVVDHYPQPIRTMAHIRGSQADNTLMNHLQHKLQTALYFSALDPLLMPVHLQTRRAQLLLEQLPLLDRVVRWYGRRGIDIPPEYTICPCHLKQPETSEHFKQCPLARGGNSLATWTPEDTIAEHVGWGPATPPANEVRRLRQQTEIKEAVLRGAVPLQLYRVIADHAREPRATICHMQLTAVKRADAQLQHLVQVYAQEAQQTSHDRRMYYNLLVHYQHAQPSD